jgi:hypothetical protein
MAPPPTQNKDVMPGGATMAESLEHAMDMEEELEKDLVLSPPPPKTETEEVRESTPRVESKPAIEKKQVLEPVVKEKKEAAAPRKAKKAPADRGRLSISQKPVQKVRPLTGNAWNRPAGTYGDRRPSSAFAARGCYPSEMDAQGFRPVCPPYMSAAPRRTIAPPPAAERFVRDGVTIKLAPAVAPPIPPQYEEELGYNEDLFSAIGEVLGLPFAFISSFF